MERHCSIETKFPSGLKSSIFFSRELDYFSAKWHWNRNVFGNRTASFGRTSKSKRTTCLGQYHSAEKFPSGTKSVASIFRQKYLEILGQWQAHIDDFPPTATFLLFSSLWETLASRNRFPTNVKGIGVREIFCQGGAVNHLPKKIS